ncbi:alpha/beta hydrolase [Luedemannella flava]|uniref:Alpha/beta hydrolase n=1 Tax=Luedemannella flava TaxID=349316 RepID=A0ABP4XYL0_9ACTN
MTTETPTNGRFSKRKVGIVSAVVGVAAAGIAAGVATERILMGRNRRITDADPYKDEPFGALGADETRTVTTADGLDLHVEIDGDPAAPLTVVLVHGFCLDIGTFHFQRKLLRTIRGVRIVAYDQPGHGLSGRLRSGEYSIQQLGRDLRTVIDETTPAGPVVLVGHSMGGMVIMALAEQSPELFGVGQRVSGVALVASSAGEMSGVTFGLPKVLAKVRTPLLPVITNAGRLTAPVWDRARQAHTDLAWMLTKRYGFGSTKVSPSLVSYVERMNASTPTDVVARYVRTIDAHNRFPALTSFEDSPTLVIVGDEDLLTPVEHAEAICRVLPLAQLVVVPNAGHVVMLEHHEAVDAVLGPFVRNLVPGGAPS